MTRYCIVDQDEREHAATENPEEELYERMDEEQIIEALHGYDEFHELVYEYLAEYATGYIKKAEFIDAIDTFITEARIKWVKEQL